eukprot:TRINITY_DN3008_c0_g2_i1.p1 TRINITY_DN3008_c0_g2~~TRINITY_DN3008_c0_g2_i1.p1  ORF type:complete len:1046 (-),score=253.85 TRINITY_DN3008_c0_g2_i1:217-3354(-)
MQLAARDAVEECGEAARRAARSAAQGAKAAPGFAALWCHFAAQAARRAYGSKVNYTLGFLACFVVVVVVAVLLSVMDHTPVVYLRLAELQTGELDVEFSIKHESGYRLINFTKLEAVLSETEEFSYLTPRWEFSIKAYNAKSCPPQYDIMDPMWKYHGMETDSSLSVCLDSTNCFGNLCGASNLKNRLVVIDSTREKRMLIGRRWTLPPVPRGGCYVKSNVASSLGLAVGDVIVVGIKPYSGDMYYLYERAVSRHFEKVNSTIIWIPFTVSAIYTNPEGKYKSKSTMGVMVEYEYFASYLATHIDPWDVTIRDYFASMNFYDHASFSILNMPPPRVDNYLSSNMDVVQKSVTAFASEATYRAGFNNLDVALPVMDNLGDYVYVGLFLGLIVNLSIVVLLFLSVVLIYSLMVINVETRTFEIGVMRTLGTTHAGVVALVLTQASLYALPSWVVGLVVAQFIEVGIAVVFESLTAISMSKWLSLSAALIASLLCFLIPALSSAMPVRSALSQTLQYALDTHRSRTQAVKVTVKRIGKRRISWTLVILGIGLAGFGFAVYYIMPASLLANNFQIMINLFFFLILAMLIGLVVLSLNLETLLEKLCCWIFFFWERSAVLPILLKNLVAHKMRNRKTTLMYAVSLSFIIFIYVAYSMEVATYSYALKQMAGGPLVVYASGRFGDNSPHTIKVVAALEAVAAVHPKITGHTWMTRNLEDSIHNSTAISNLGHIYSYGQRVYGVSPNFFDVTYKGFLKVHDEVNDPSLPSDALVTERLYTPMGSQSLAVGTSYRQLLGLDTGEHLLLTVSNSAPRRYRVSTFLDAAAVFGFSKYPSVTRQDCIVSFLTFMSLTEGRINTMPDLPLGEFIVKVADDATDADLTDISDKLNQVVSSQPDYTPEIWDYRDEMAALNVATGIMTYFFLLTTAIAMATSFFSLTAGMLANVYEQTKEIGILRAIGLTKFAISRVYIYEAFVVVFGASLFGIIIGVLVAWTMTLQQLLFTQLPIPFVFPWQLFVTVSALSVVFGVLAALVPIVRVVSLPVVQIMRMLN